MIILKNILDEMNNMTVDELEELAAELEKAAEDCTYGGCKSCKSESVKADYDGDLLEKLVEDGDHNLKLSKNYRKLLIDIFSIKQENAENDALEKGEEKGYESYDAAFLNGFSKGIAEGLRVLKESNFLIED